SSRLGLLLSDGPRLISGLGRERRGFVKPMSLIKTLAVIVLCINKSSAPNGLDLVAIDSYLNPYVQGGNFAGNVLVERNGRVIFERAYGFANREKRVRSTSTTRFHIASISMQFTAAAVLRLVDKG